VLSCDLPSFARAGRVLRPHPAMLAPVQPTRHTAHCTHPLPWLRISLRSRAQSSRRASCADSKRRAGAGEAPSSRRRAPAGHLRADGNENVSRREGTACAPMDSSSTAVAHREGRLRQRPGGTPTRVRLPNSFVPSGGAIGPGHGGDSLAACCALTAERPFCTWLVTHARAAGTCRAAQARDSSGK